MRPLLLVCVLLVCKVSAGEYPDVAVPSYPDSVTTDSDLEKWNGAIELGGKQDEVDRQINQLIGLVQEAKQRDNMFSRAFDKLDTFFGQILYLGSTNAETTSSNTDLNQLIADVVKEEKEIDATTPLNEAIDWINDRDLDMPVTRSAAVALNEAKKDLELQLQRIKDATSALYVMKAMSGESSERSEVRALRLAGVFYRSGGAQAKADRNINGNSIDLQHALGYLGDFSRNYA